MLYNSQSNIKNKIHKKEIIWCGLILDIAAVIGILW